MFVHPPPFQWANRTFGGEPLPSSPTAHPSPLPDPVPNVSMKTDLRFAVFGVTWLAPPAQLTPSVVIATVAEAPTTTP